MFRGGAFFPDTVYKTTQFRTLTHSDTHTDGRLPCGLRL